MSTQETVAAAINGLILTDYADALEYAPNVIAAYESDPPRWLKALVQQMRADEFAHTVRLYEDIPESVRRAAGVL